MIWLSPFHKIKLSEQIQHYVDHPPDHNYALVTLASKQANGMQLMQAELVVACAETRKSFPLAEKYPVHFVKTHYPAHFHADPKTEFERTNTASELLNSPPPIGFDTHKFRSCFIPGQPYSKLSPFGVEPHDQNIPIAQQSPKALLVGLWKMLEEAFLQISKLHDADLCHGDLELHNIVTAFSPVRTFLIDYETAIMKSELEEARWNDKTATDLLEILRESIYLQCGLGAQEGPLAEKSLSSLPDLFKNPKRFERSIREADKYR